MIPSKQYQSYSDPSYSTSTRTERDTCYHFQVSPTQRMELQSSYAPYDNPTVVPTMESSYSRENRGFVVTSEEMDRGLGIDFYQVADHQLLASWASYFRDHYIQVRSELKNLQRTHDQVLDQLRRRDADLFVRMIDEQHFLESREVRELCQKRPVMMSSSGDDCQLKESISIDFGSALATRCLDMVFEKVAVMPEEGKAQRFLPFNTPEWRESLWYLYGLKELVGRICMNHTKSYAETIRDSVDACFSKQKTRKGQEHQLNVAREFFSATLHDTDELVAQRKLMPIYAQVIARLGLDTNSSFLSVPLDEGSIGKGGSPKKRQSLNAPLLESLEGKLVKDFFSTEEEAFLRLTIQKYLLVSFRSHFCEMSTPSTSPCNKEVDGQESRYNQCDDSYLTAMCEKVSVHRDVAWGVFHTADIEVPCSNDSSPSHHGKKARRNLQHGNTDDELEAEEPPYHGMETRARKASV